MIRTALIGVVILLATAPVAGAGTFDIKTPDIEAGETEVSVNTTFFMGFPVNSERLRHSGELGVGYGLTEWWKGGLKFNTDKPIGDDLQVTTWGTEHQFLLRKLNGGFGLGWYTSADLRVADDATNTLTLGPILQFGTEKTSLILNPFLARTFGQNREAGVAFSYGWQVKHELREGLAVGIEGYGVVPNIADSPGLRLQEHRIGPVLYFERPLARHAGGRVKDVKGGDDNGPKFNGEIGVLFGLTEGTQDVAFKVKGGITF